MSKIYCIHGRTPKVTIADVRIARDFFEHHLFKPMRALMDLRTLKLSPKTQLNAISLNVLYQVNMHDGIGYLYLLCHKNSVKQLMSSRLLSYVIRIWTIFKWTGSKDCSCLSFEKMVQFK